MTMPDKFARMKSARDASAPGGRADEAHLADSELVGKNLRAMMSWIGESKVIDKAKNRIPPVSIQPSMRKCLSNPA